jgi:hypothetical protein
MWSTVIFVITPGLLMRILRKRVALALIPMAMVFNAHADQPINRNGNTLINTELGHCIQFEIAVQPVRLPLPEANTSLPNMTQEFGPGHIDDREVTSISMRWGNLGKQAIARSAFSDVFNPARVEHYQKGRHLVLILHGGDASSSYRMELELAPHGAVSRRIHNHKSGYEERASFHYPAYHTDAVWQRLGTAAKEILCNEFDKAEADAEAPLTRRYEELSRRFDMNKPQTWRFSFSAPDRKKLERLASVLSQSGYAAQYAVKDGANTLTLKQLTTFRPDNLQERLFVLQDLAKAYEVAYEGWDLGEAK